MAGAGRQKRKSKDPEVQEPSEESGPARPADTGSSSSSAPSKNHSVQEEEPSEVYAAQKVSGADSHQRAPLYNSCDKNLSPEEENKIFEECLKEIRGRLTPQTLGNWLYVLGNSLRGAIADNFKNIAQLNTFVLQTLEKICNSEAFALFCEGPARLERYPLGGLVQWIQRQATGGSPDIDAAIAQYRASICKIAKDKDPTPLYKTWLDQTSMQLVGGNCDRPEREAARIMAHSASYMRNRLRVPARVQKRFQEGHVTGKVPVPESVNKSPPSAKAILRDLEKWRKTGPGSELAFADLGGSGPSKKKRPGADAIEERPKMRGFKNPESPTDSEALQHAWESTEYMEGAENDEPRVKTSTRGGRKPRGSKEASEVGTEEEGEEEKSEKAVVKREKERSAKVLQDRSEAPGSLSPRGKSGKKSGGKAEETSYATAVKGKKKGLLPKDQEKELRYLSFYQLGLSSENKRVDKILRDNDLTVPGDLCELFMHSEDYKDPKAVLEHIMQNATGWAGLSQKIKDLNDDAKDECKKLLKEANIQHIVRSVTTERFKPEPHAKIARRSDPEAADKCLRDIRTEEDLEELSEEDPPLKVNRKAKKPASGEAKGKADPSDDPGSPPSPRPEEQKKVEKKKVKKEKQTPKREDRPILPPASPKKLDKKPPAPELPAKETEEPKGKGGDEMEIDAGAGKGGETQESPPTPGEEGKGASERLETSKSAEKAPELQEKKPPLSTPPEAQALIAGGVEGDLEKERQLVRKSPSPPKKRKTPDGEETGDADAQVRDDSRAKEAKVPRLDVVDRADSGLRTPNTLPTPGGQLVTRPEVSQSLHSGGTVGTAGAAFALATLRSPSSSTPYPRASTLAAANQTRQVRTFRIDAERGTISCLSVENEFGPPQVVTRSLAGYLSGEFPTFRPGNGDTVLFVGDAPYQLMSPWLLRDARPRPDSDWTLE